MKHYLSYNGQLEITEDDDLAKRLLARKRVRVDPPDYDPATEALEWKDGKWVVRDLTAEEIAAAYEAANPPAKQFQVRIWMARNGINPETIPAVIETQTQDGPARWEALERWRTVQDIPITHPMVGLLFLSLKQAGAVPADKTLEQVWQEILALS